MSQFHTEQLPFASLVKIAENALIKGNLSLASAYYDKAARRAKQDENVDGQIKALCKFAVCTHSKGDRQAADSIWERLNDLLPADSKLYRDSRFLVYSSIASSRFQKSNWVEAQSFAQWALQLKGATSFKELEGYLHWLIGQSACYLKDVPLAIREMEVALALSEASEPENTINIKRILARLYLANSNFEGFQRLSEEILEIELAKQAVESSSKSELIDQAWRGQHSEPAVVDRLSEFICASAAAVRKKYISDVSLRERLVNINRRLLFVMEDCKGLLLQVRISRKQGRLPRTRKQKLRISNEDWLEIYFLQQSLACWLSSINLALSGQLVATNLVLRGALENAMYALMVFFKPELKSVWLERTDGEFPGDNTAFSVSKIWTMMELNCSYLLDRVRKAYKVTIEAGAHPNLNAFERTAFVVSAGGNRFFGVEIVDEDKAVELSLEVEEVGAVLIAVINLIIITSDNRSSAMLSVFDQALRTSSRSRP